MFVGRREELALLEKWYGEDKNSCLVLYGRKGVGKTELLRKFLEGKNALYYQVRECSEREQFLVLKREWRGGDHLINGDFYSLMLEVMEAKEGKKVVVLDEFDRLVKNGTALLSTIRQVWEEHKEAGGLMFVLLSSSIQWVENDMDKELGDMAQRITECRRIKEFSFLEMVSRFPNLSTQDCVQIYGILGGVPAYLNRWKENEGVKDNVKRLFFSKEETFSMELENYLKLELRELSIYNTMLAVLAEGRTKLNDIHDRTGFNRAKISVYLKNLIQMGVVEKVSSYGAGSYENTRKGLYTIREPFLYFWYRFCFPNLARREMEGAQSVWEECVEPYLDEYMERFFILVCKEYLDLMNQYGRLPFRYQSTCGSWYGKTGDLNLVVKNKKGQSLVGNCKWSDELSTEGDLQELLATMEQAGLEADYYYLFSKSGFSDSMWEKAKQMENIVLTDMEGL